PGTELLGVNSGRTNDLLTVTLTLSSAPGFMKAVACGAGGVTGGIWGAEFWAAASGDDGRADGGNTFYLAYRDNPPDGTAAVEAGRVDDTNITVTSLEFDPTDPGTPAMPGGTCFSVSPPS